MPMSLSCELRMLEELSLPQPRSICATHRTAYENHLNATLAAGGGSRVVVCVHCASICSSTDSAGTQTFKANTAVGQGTLGATTFT
jgi:hypothetical protein